MGSLAKQGKRNKGKNRPTPDFTEAGKLNEDESDINKDTTQNTNKNTNETTAPTADTDTEAGSEVNTEDKPVEDSNEIDTIEALRRKHEAERAKKKKAKKQISTYLEPEVLKAYNKYGTEKGDKQKLINDLLKAYFGIDDE